MVCLLRLNTFFVNWYFTNINVIYIILTNFSIENWFAWWKYCIIMTIIIVITLLWLSLPLSLLLFLVVVVVVVYYYHYYYHYHHYYYDHYYCYHYCYYYYYHFIIHVFTSLRNVKLKRYEAYIDGSAQDALELLQICSWRLIGHLCIGCILEC